MKVIDENGAKILLDIMEYKIDNVKDWVDNNGYITNSSLEDYYNKAFIDEYSIYVNSQIVSKADADNVYTKIEIDSKLGDINTVLENILS